MPLPHQAGCLSKSGTVKTVGMMVLQENGLKLSNSWAGYHVLLNPDYSAQILWRFVNRAIDEVENNQARTSVDMSWSSRSSRFRKQKCVLC